MNHNVMENHYKAKCNIQIAGATSERAGERGRLTTAAPLPVCTPPSQGMLMGVPGLLWVYGVVPWSVPKSSRECTTRKSSPHVLKRERDREIRGGATDVNLFCYDP